MRRAGERTAFISLSLMLSACGGGNGGTTTSFTSWSTVEPSSVVVTEGLSEQDGTVSPSFIGTTATITVDANRHWTNLVLRTPDTTVDVDFVGVLPGGFLDAASTDLASSAVVADPVPLGYQYQTFGIWETQSATADTTGAFSVGAPSTSVPSTGSATFQGKLAGFYVDPGGLRYYAFGDMTVTADFANRTLGLAASNTAIKQNLSDTGTPRPDLNLSGQLSYAAGTNSFSGGVTTVGTSLGNLSGTTSGQFYGPSALELGGVFSLTDPLDPNSPESYTGAYGAAQVP